MRAGRGKACNVPFVGCCPSPSNRHGISILKNRFERKALIGERSARQTHALLKAGRAKRLPIPWIARIVAHSVGFPNKVVARLYSSLGPNLLNEGCQQPL